MTVPNKNILYLIFSWSWNRFCGKRVARAWGRLSQGPHGSGNVHILSAHAVRHLCTSTLCTVSTQLLYIRG